MYTMASKVDFTRHRINLRYMSYCSISDLTEGINSNKNSMTWCCFSKIVLHMLTFASFYQLCIFSLYHSLKRNWRLFQIVNIRKGLADIKKTV